MHVLSSCFLLIAITLIAPPVESQYDGLGSLFVPADNYFRSGQLHPSYDGRKQELESQARFFFTTLTVTLASTTTTTTSTTTTICTTSTSALKVCTPSGRRRRGVLLSNLGAQGLYYNDQEDEDGEGDIFLRSSPKSSQEPEWAVQNPEPTRIVREIPAIPFVVQPGFQPPKEVGNARFLLAFGTTTSTRTTTTTYISTLTATCKSTTAYQTCGSSGK